MNGNQISILAMGTRLAAPLVTGTLRFFTGNEITSGTSNVDGTGQILFNSIRVY